MDLNEAYPKDSFPLPHIDQIVDASIGHGILVDPQFCPSTLTFYPMDVTLTHRSHMAPLGPYLTLVGFRASSGLVCGLLSAYVVNFEVSSWRFFLFFLLASCHRKQVGPLEVLA